MYKQAFPRQLVLLFLCLNFFFSCEKNNTEDDGIMGGGEDFDNGVFILNEGQFNNGNASLSFFDFETEQLSEEIFQSENNRPLGDVLQSMSINGDLMYLVLNNSAKVEVVSSNRLESVAQIDDLTSPRYFLEVNSEKAYVSDLYADAVSVVNLNDFSIQGTIPMPAWTEQMIKVGTEVWVSMPWFFQDEPSPFMYIIDSNLDTVIDSVEVGIDQVAMLVDNEFLYVYCKGRPAGEVRGGLIRINISTREVQELLAFEDFDFNFAPRMAIHPSNGKLYFTKKDIFALDLETGGLTKVVDAEGRDFYGLGIDSKSGNLWVSDAIDFQQKSDIYEYSADGTLIQSFKGGIATNSFYFN